MDPLKYDSSLRIVFDPFAMFLYYHNIALCCISISESVLSYNFWFYCKTTVREQW